MTIRPNAPGIFVMGIFVLGIFSLAVALAACGGSSKGSGSGSAPAPAAAAEPQEPDPPFVGRIWITTTPGAARGSLLIFLPDRTLLLDSCFETYRLSKWGGNAERIRWIEDSIPVEAEVRMPRRDQLVLHVAGQDHDQSFAAASVPYVCPDMPK